MIMPTSDAVVQVAMVPARMDFKPMPIISTFLSGTIVTSDWFSLLCRVS